MAIWFIILKPSSSLSEDTKGKQKPQLQYMYVQGYIKYGTIGRLQLFSKTDP